MRLTMVKRSTAMAETTMTYIYMIKMIYAYMCVNMHVDNSP